MTTNGFTLVLIVVLAASLNFWFTQNTDDSTASTVQGGTKVQAHQTVAELSDVKGGLGDSPGPDKVLENTNPFKVVPGEKGNGENLVAKRPDVEHPPVPCGRSCTAINELLISFNGISDSELEHALGLTDELAATLIDNPKRQSELIKLALDSFGNTRMLIISAFNQLEPVVQRKLGKVLAESDQMAQRLDGIQLLSSAEVIDEGMVPFFEQLYLTESDTYVREAIVKGLDRPDVFGDNAAVVDFLTAVIHSDTESAVRGGALLASVRLSDNADFAISQSLEAVRSDTGDYQGFGARALSNFMNSHTLNGKEISLQHRLEVEQLMSEIMTDKFDDMPEQARTQLDDLYSRFF
ncbi:hypothetical protein N9383_03320 [Granulosicoccus sp.]|nr:hypothetical protein [Granulosicoccus sp.]